jgi:general secretion pathway protein E
LLGVLAQRLVRKLCPDCHGKGLLAPTLRTHVAALPPEGADPALGRPGGGVGCDACGKTGYQGRTGVFELLMVDDVIREQIHGRNAEAEIRASARAHGMRLMREDGERLVAAGITSRAEVLRVTSD